VVFEVESIDRMYLNVSQPRLAYGGGVQGFFVGHRGHHYASTALMDPMTKTFVADIHGFVAARGLELVHFGLCRTFREDDSWCCSGRPGGQLVAWTMLGMPAAFLVLAAGAAPAGRVACWWPGDEFGRGDTGALGGVAGARAGGGGIMAGAVAPALKRVDLDRGDPQGDGASGGHFV